jgi:hypothetical protein
MTRYLSAAVLLIGMAGTAVAQCVPPGCSNIGIDDMPVYRAVPIPEGPSPRVLWDCAYTLGGCTAPTVATEITIAGRMKLGEGAEIRGPLTVYDPYSGQIAIELKKGEVLHVGGTQ